MTPEAVLVAGASSGIGRELARCFAVDGSKLVLATRSARALESLAGGLRKARKVAQIGHQAFRRGRVVVVPGLGNRLLAFSVRFSPRSVARKIAGALNQSS